MTDLLTRRRVAWDAFARRSGDALAWFVLAALGVALFWVHITGRGIFLGDSDRLNTFLNMRKFEIESLRDGGLHAWNEFTFMGVSLYGIWLPDLLTRLEALWPAAALFRVAGFVACGLMIAAAWAAYAFIKDTCGDPFSAFVGASLYAFSAPAVLRIAQVDFTFEIFIDIPLGLLLLKRIGRESAARCFVGLSLVLLHMFLLTFLQEAAYALVLFAAYAAYRGRWLSSWRPPVVFVASLVVGTLGAIPRVYTAFEDLRLMAPRAAYPWTPNRWELLRLLNDGMFGRDHREAEAIGNTINLLNLHEGVLLYTSTIAALLVLVGLVRFRGQWLRLFRFRDGDASFHAGVFVLVLVAILTPVGQVLLQLLFLNQRFLHARFSLLALLPECVLVSVLLVDLLPGSDATPGPRPKMVFLAGAALASAGLVWSIDHAGSDTVVAMLGLGRWIDTGARLHIMPAELVRTAWAAVVFGLLLLATWRVSRARPARSVLIYTLGLVAACQAFGSAFFKLDGPATWSFPIPFEQYDFFTVPPGHIQIPGPEALAAFHDALEVDRYRSVLICDPRAYVDCAPHVAQFWRLRLVDGYVPGVPSRLASLPWPRDVKSARAIRFSAADKLNGPILGLLNVKYAVVVNEALYYNLAPPGTSERTEARPSDVQAHLNPFPVVPRQFFAAAVRPVSSAAEGVTALRLSSPPQDWTPVMAQSVAEGFPAPARFSTVGEIRARYRQDRIEIDLDPIEEPRFLVLNELYHPRWHAFANGRELLIYPTNVVMRGVIVPPGTSRLELRFVPFLLTASAAAFFTTSLTLLLAGWFGTRLSAARSESATGGAGGPPRPQRADD